MRITKSPMEFQGVHGGILDYFFSASFGGVKEAFFGDSESFRAVTRSPKGFRGFQRIVEALQGRFRGF